jgi:hypothetical protein
MRPDGLGHEPKRDRNQGHSSLCGDFWRIVCVTGIVHRCQIWTHIYTRHDKVEIVSLSGYLSLGLCRGHVWSAGRMASVCDDISPSWAGKVWRTRLGPGLRLLQGTVSGSPERRDVPWPEWPFVLIHRTIPVSDACAQDLFTQFGGLDTVICHAQAPHVPD